MSKISGPLLDRIDLHVDVPAVPLNELRSRGEPATSEQMRGRVLAARARQIERGWVNAMLPPSVLREVCALDEAGERTLEMAVRRLGLSARAHDRILKVARTIADLGGEARIQAKHIAVPVQDRSLDRNYWNWPSVGPSRRPSFGVAPGTTDSRKQGLDEEALRDRH